MREFLFRAWDKADNRWAFKDDPLLYLMQADNSGLHLGALEIQQWTGLVDKAGARIYEGDILGGAHISGGYEVFRNEYKAAWDVRGGSGYLSAWMNTFTLGIEVIGNIYENPELLESKS